MHNGGKNMMTHEEIEAAIERLRKLYTYSAREAVDAVIPDGLWADGLIELLEQADPDTHMELPRDADGTPIHIGDELISKHSKRRLVVTRLQYSRKHAWMVGGADRDDLSEYGLYAPCETSHYQPTVSSILDELEGLRGTGDYEAVVTRAAELTEQLRELLEVTSDEAKAINIERGSIL